MLERQTGETVLVAGVDGCRGGWLVAAADSRDLAHPSLAAVTAFKDIWNVFGDGPDVVAADIPVGLVNQGRRRADVLARELLGRRAASVFTPPERMLLEYANLEGFLSPGDGRSQQDRHAAVNEWSNKFLGHGVAVQAFGIYPKIAEVDIYMRAERDSRLHESHPELVFRQMNGGVVIDHPKRSESGREARAALLRQSLGADPDGIEVEAAAGVTCRADDIFDALALMWTAARISEGEAERIPEEPQCDALGLDMAIWF